MPSRRKAREQALQILFLIDLANTPVSEAIELFRANFEHQEAALPFAQELVEGTRSRLADLDATLEKNSENWKISRMPRIDRNILRLGVYEIMFCKETPGPVIVDEAVELAKRFGEKKSGAFVNGILDRVLRDYRGKDEG